MSATDTPLPASPCIRHCCLDQQDVCLGCYRTLQDILDWGQADAEQRLKILDAARDRAKARESSVSWWQQGIER